MTPEEIAKKYVHGLHDALTDTQEKKDMANDIRAYCEEYHQAKLRLLSVTDVAKQNKQVFCAYCGSKKRLKVETDITSGRVCKSKMCPK